MWRVSEILQWVESGEYKALMNARNQQLRELQLVNEGVSNLRCVDAFCGRNDGKLLFWSNPNLSDRSGKHLINALKVTTGYEDPEDSFDLPYYLVSKKREKSGHWKYENYYSGRGGKLDRWEVQYNIAREQFEGRLVRTENDNRK